MFGKATVTLRALPGASSVTSRAMSRRTIASLSNRLCASGNYPEGEAARIPRIGFLAACKREHHARVRLFRKRKFARRREAVDRQAVCLSVHFVAALPKPGDIRKQRERPVAPVGGIALSEILRAVV